VKFTENAQECEVSGIFSLFLCSGGWCSVTHPDHSILQLKHFFSLHYIIVNNRPTFLHSTELPPLDRCGWVRVFALAFFCAWQCAALCRGGCDRNRCCEQHVIEQSGCYIVKYVDVITAPFAIRRFHACTVSLSYCIMFLFWVWCVHRRPNSCRRCEAANCAGSPRSYSYGVEKRAASHCQSCNGQPLLASDLR
jgi:hypothetical protein